MIVLPQLGSDTVCAVHGRGPAIISELHYDDGSFFRVGMECDPTPIELCYPTAVRLTAQWGGIRCLVNADSGTRAEVGVAILKSGLTLLAEIDHF